MKIKFILPILFFLFVSCTDEDDSSFIENSPPILVKKIITKNIDNTIFDITENEYLGNKIIKSTSQNGDKIFYTYIGELISKIEIKDVSNNLKVEYLYSYENNKLTQSLYKLPNENICEKRLYSYGSNNNVSFVYYKGDLITQNILYKSGTIVILNNEVKSINVDDFTDSSNKVVNYIYDEKNNPQKNILGIDKLNVELDRAGGAFQNTFSFDTTINNGITFFSNNSLEYDANNYPIKATVNIFGTLYRKMEYYY
jgi:hypothetical protein